MKLDFNSIEFKNWLSFMLFSVLILALLWIFQVIFFNSFYLSMKTTEVVRIGDEIVRQFGEDDFDNKISLRAFHNNFQVNVLDQFGVVISSTNSFNSSPDKRYKGELAPGQFIDFLSKLQGKEKVNYIEGNRQRQFIVYGAQLKDKNGDTLYLYINCPLTPSDSTVAVLKKQLLIITVFLLVLSLILARFISRKLTLPLSKLTQSAKHLATGDLNVHFDQKDYTEISQLSETLNYATVELSKLDEYRKDFIANVSHDLRTPLTIIKFYAEMIQDISGSDAQKRNAHCELIIKESDRLTNLVNEVLELSKLESNNASLNIIKFNISKCVEDILQGLAVLTEKGFSFESDIQQDLFVNADESAIKRVIYNLISNAINYTGEDKTIRVNLKRQKESHKSYIRFEVVDTGKGIPKEEINHIWERYYKAKETHKRPVVGTGLGLAIVKNVLLMHGAKFGVVSEEGKGSTFWFELNGAD